MSMDELYYELWPGGMYWAPGASNLMTPDGQVAGVVNYKAVARFTAPLSSTYQVVAYFKNSRTDEAAADVSVRVNGVAIGSKTISGFGYNSTYPVKTAVPAAIYDYAANLDLQVGDTLDFVVSSSKTYHQVGFNAIIEAGEPLPPTMNLVMQLDAGTGVSDPNRPGETLVDGDRVGLWADQAGNGLDARAKSGWGSPILKTDGDFDVVRFDGNDGMVIYDLSEPNDQEKFLDLEDPNDKGPLDLGSYTIYVVGKLNQFATPNLSQVFLANYNAVQGYGLGISDSLPDYVKFWTNNGGEMRSGRSIYDEEDPGRYYLLAATITNTAGKKLIVNDCVEDDSYGMSSYTKTTAVTVGALAGGTQFLKGDIAEIRVYDGFIEATHLGVVNELVNKYGLDRECLGGPNLDQVVLTALTFFGTTSTGSVREEERWNTLWDGVDGAWDIALASGSIAELAAIPDPNDIPILNIHDNMNIYVQMEKGQEYTFTWVNPTSGSAQGENYGMNFYFDSAEKLGKPHGISVFGNVTDPGEDPEAFQANDSATTMGYPITSVPGAGTLIYKDYVKGLAVTLTPWVVYHPDVFNVDFVTGNNNVTHALSDDGKIKPDGNTDFIGQFTLSVDSYTPNCEDDLIPMGGKYFFMDFNQDCYVNLEDFAEFAQDWLRCNDPGNLNCEQVK